MSIKCGTRWEEKETRLFVKLYLQHECLWNMNHEDYKFKSVKNDAIQDIITKFARITNIVLDGVSFTKKIKSLRSTYSQELKMIKCRASQGSDYTPTLKWFQDYDTCIRLGLPFKDDGGELNKVENYHSIDNRERQVWLTSENRASTEDKQTDDTFTHDDDDYLLLLKTEHEENEYSRTERPVQNKRRKIKKRTYSSSSEDEIISNHERKNKRKSHIEKSAVKEDEFDIYGKYIASQLRELGLPKALNVQLKIQSIVSEARIEHYSEDG